MKRQQMQEARGLRLVALAGLIGVLGTALSDGSALFVTSVGTTANTGQILEYNDTTGAFIGVFASGLNFPSSLALGPNGDIYVATAIGTQFAASSSILKYKLDGTPDGTFVATTPRNVFSMSFAPDGTLYTAGFIGAGADNVQRYNANGTTLGLPFGTSSGQANSPVALALPTGGGSYNALLTDNVYGMVRMSANGSSGISSNSASHSGGDQFLSLSIAANGKVYMGSLSSKLWELDQPSGFTAFTQVAGTGAIGGSFGIDAIGSDLSGDVLYGGNVNTSNIYKLSPNGVSTIFIAAGSGGLDGVGFGGILDVVPEPSTVLLMGLGSLWLWRRTRTNQTTA